jgi:hypothetical protein
MKVTEIVQVALIARLEPHVFVWIKSAEAVPVTEMPFSVRAAPVVFANVTVCAELMLPLSCGRKLSAPGEGPNDGAEPEGQVPSKQETSRL